LNKNHNISKNFKWSEFLVSEDFPDIVEKYSLFCSEDQEVNTAIQLEFMKEHESQGYPIIEQPLFLQFMRTKIWFFTHNTLQPIRSHLGFPLTVSSGWRPKELNSVTPGASKTSDHLYRGMSCAVDMHVAAEMQSKFYKEMIPHCLKATRVPYGQCIIYKTFFHISSITEKHQYEVINK